MSKKAILDLTGAFTKDMLARLDKAEAERDKLKAQRDALLAAAKRCLPYMEEASNLSFSGVATDCFHQLQAAIEEAEKP